MVRIDHDCMMMMMISIFNLYIKLCNIIQQLKFKFVFVIYILSFQFLWCLLRYAKHQSKTEKTNRWLVCDSIISVCLNTLHFLLLGYFSWRNSTKGSWFCQALVMVLKQHAETRDLMWMMTRVNRMVAYEFESNASKEFMNRKKQIPCITSMLTKDVYFRPKN